MSFIPKEPTAFLSIRLTNTGRRMASLGRLNFNSAVLSDREIDYEFGLESDWDHACNRVLMTKDAAPNLPYSNFDGTPPIPLAGNIYSDKKVVTATTVCYGIFSANNATDFYGTFSGYVNNTSLSLSSAITTTAQLVGTNQVLMTNGTPPRSGIVGFTGMKTRFGPALSAGINQSYTPQNVLWYRFSAITSVLIALDRNAPYFDGAAIVKGIGLFFLPWSGASTYFGTVATTSSPVWNLSIVRTSSEIGTPDLGLKYNRYGSIEFAGTKRYFGFDMDTRAVGFLHYTNADTGNTYGEQFIPKATVVDMPLIFWHRYQCAPGTGQIRGVRFTDQRSEIYYDTTAHSNYTLLMEDTPFGGSQAVGRVYYRLRMIVLTDPELLTAMSYKSNRNWTLPPLQLSLVADPKPPLTNMSASGLCQSGKSYYVTYRYISNQPVSTTSYGYGPAMHCGYVQKIKGFTDENGRARYLSARFPSLAFPMLRRSTEFFAYSGTGWSANKVQLLVAEVDDADDLGLGYVPTNSWKALSDLSIGGNGILSGSSYSAAVDPEELGNHQFIVSYEDYASGSTYDLSQFYPDFFARTDFSADPSLLGLTYGNESIFTGVIRTTIAATVFKSTWMVAAPDDQFNSSLNSSFNGEVNHSTYITEIGIFDDQQQLVGVAKPTWPIKKNQGRYLTFELEFDF